MISRPLLSAAEFERMADEMDEIASAIAREQRDEASFAERLRLIAEQLRRDAQSASLSPSSPDNEETEVGSP